MARKTNKQNQNRIGVFGLGRFGFGLAVRLAELGADVLAVDSRPQTVEEIDPRVSRAICLDVTNEFAMRKLNLDALDLAIVCIGRNIQASLLCTAVLRKLKAKGIWVRAIDQTQAEILDAMNVDRILSIEKEMAIHAAQDIMLPGTELIAPLTSDHSVVEVRAWPSFVGKTLGQLDFRNAYGVNVVAIKTQRLVTSPEGGEEAETHVNDLPHASDVIHEGDVLVVIGTDEQIRRLQDASENIQA